MKPIDSFRNLTINTVDDLGHGMELCTISGKFMKKIAVMDIKSMLSWFDNSIICGIWPKEMKSRSPAASLLLRKDLCSSLFNIHEEKGSYWIECNKPARHLDFILSKDVFYREVSFFIAMSDNNISMTSLLDEKTIADSSGFFGFNPSDIYIREAAVREVVTIYASSSNSTNLLMIKSNGSSMN